MAASEERQSIWSIDPGTRRLHLWMTAIVLAVALALVAWGEATRASVEPETIPQTIATVLRAAMPLVFPVAALTFLVTEVLGGGIMVLIDWARARGEARRKALREAMRAEGRAEGHAEGRAEGYAEWRDWYERREAALANGEPFDELPPGASPNGRRDDSS